jgi:hypothetical protein
LSRKSYVVSGPVAFLGFRPGEKFEAELDEGLERRAIARGSIKPAKPAKPNEQEEVEGDA